MEKLLTKKQVAEMLGIKESTLYAWVHQNRIPHLKIGKRLLRFREKDIIAWLSDMEVQPDPHVAPKPRARRLLVGIKTKDGYIDAMVKNAKKNIRWN
jgi:excisionase family DNA binding protein